MYGQRPRQNRQSSTQSSTGGYRLADKLRQEYHGRGANVSGIRAASTEELMARAQMGRDPRENVSEEAFSDRLRNPNYTYDRSRYHMEDTQTFSRVESQVKSPGSPSYRHTPNRTPGGKTQKKTAKKQPDVTPGEVQIQGRGLSVGYIIMLAVITTMVILVLFSIAQVYKTNTTIADLEKELVSLENTASKLELALEEKNDIRIIEQIATDQLGMVKEDSIQRRYISLSEGERIDVVAEETGTETGIWGTMLSSLGSLWERLFGNGNG